MMKKDGVQSWIIAFSILLVGIGIFYTFFWKPFYKEHKFNACLSASEEKLTSKNSELDNKIAELNKRIEVTSREAQEKLDIFLRENSEPEVRRDQINKQGHLSVLDRARIAAEGGLFKDNIEDSKRHFDWQMKRDAISQEKNDLEKERNTLHRQQEENAKTQKSEKEECYKLYK
jgi:hypothetical protein